MLLLKDAIMEYLLECKVRRLSQGTIDNYDRHLRYMRRYLEDECGITRLEDVKAAHLKRFLLEKEDLGRKPQYINDLLKVFKTFFRYCVEEEYLKTSPAAKVKSVRQPKVLIRTFNEEEVLKMLNFHNGHDFMARFEAMREEAASKNGSYARVLKWFRQTFPNFYVMVRMMAKSQHNAYMHVRRWFLMRFPEMGQAA